MLFVIFALSGWCAFDWKALLFKNLSASFVARGKGKKKKANEETICPVCNEKIIGTSEELNEHVDQCLKQVRTVSKFC